MAEPADITAFFDRWMDKVPDELKPVMAKYGPILAQWTVAEIWAWIELVRKDPVAAYRTLLAAMYQDGSAILAEFDEKIADHAGLNIDRSAMAAVGREAMGAILGGVLRILSIRLGF